MPRLLTILAMLAAGVLAAGAAAYAADYGPEGAPHAGPFRYTCPPNNYLVGIAGKASDHLDKVGALCAPWSPENRQLGVTSPGAVFGRSMEGTPTSAICKADEAVSAMDANAPFIKLTCSKMLPPHAPDVAEPEFGSNTPGGQQEKSQCPADQLGIGIQGHAGQNVSSISLICGPAPK